MRGSWPSGLLNYFISDVQIHTDIDAAKALEAVASHRFTLASRRLSSINTVPFIRESLALIYKRKKQRIKEDLQAYPGLLSDFVLALDVSGDLVPPKSKKIDQKYSIIVRSATAHLSIDPFPGEIRMTEDLRMQISKLHHLGYNVIVVFTKANNFDDIHSQLKEAVTCEEKRRRPVQFIPQDLNPVASKIDLQSKLI